MIEPLPKGEAYPARLPPLGAQWRRLGRGSRAAILGGPLLVVALLFAVDVGLGVVAAVMVVGVELASAVYVKNRTDRHNAAVDRGEVRLAADPQLRAASVSALGDGELGRLAGLGYPADDLGEVAAFAGGWIVKRRNRHDVGVVLGDDDRHAYFDPRRVDDFRAASEYRAGRGREPSGT